MKFSDLKKTILAQFMAPKGNSIVPFIEGKPGGGKSACAREIADVLKEKLKIKDEQIVEFNPSLRDPVDVLGIPFKHVSGTHNEWLPPAEFYNLRFGVGPCVLIIEELSDAQMSMQNPMCRIILDRYAGSLKLSDQLYIIATGNRVEDRSGANRLSTKLGNRLRCLTFEEDLEDWVKWARAHNIDDVLIKFLQFQPNLLSDFDPKRKIRRREHGRRSATFLRLKVIRTTFCSYSMQPVMWVREQQQLTVDSERFICLCRTLVS